MNRAMKQHQRKRKRRDAVPTPEKTECRSSRLQCKTADPDEKTCDAINDKSDAIIENPIPLLTEMSILETAMEYLKQRDPVLQSLMERHGAATSLLTKSEDCPFGSLSRSICYQQYVSIAYLCQNNTYYTYVIL